MRMRIETSQQARATGLLLINLADNSHVVSGSVSVDGIDGTFDIAVSWREKDVERDEITLYRDVINVTGDSNHTHRTLTGIQTTNRVW